jgi:hypothetical protein
MNIAVVLVMATSVALIGNAFYTLQAADVITFTRTAGPNLPIFFAEATGIWPTMPSLVAQTVLVTIYVLGALYAFVLKPRLARSPRHRVVNAPA